MTPEEVFKLPHGELPVLCRDGMMGLLTVYPLNKLRNGAPENSDKCGVQVPGEQYHRWIKPEDLEHLEGGAIVEKGAPRAPLNPAHVGEATRMSHLLISADWAKRGAESVYQRLDALRNGKSIAKRSRSI